ncbi:ABC transporter permease [Nonomuraea insulae]|uniref:ABC transporter permease n=1 Tax=Nonomuraea insulae TaxID=1616787 RepID=A0ABW1DCW4_9ACTN
MLRPLLVVTAQELRTRIFDGTALLVALVAPVLLATIFGLALGGDDPPLRATVGYVDLDGGEFPASVRGEMAAAEELKGVLTLRDLPTREEARRQVDDGVIGAAIVFLPGFSQSVGAGRGGEVTVLSSPEAPLAGVLAQAVVDRMSALVEARTLAVRASIAAGVPGAEVQAFVERNGANGPALGLSADSLSGGKVDLAVYYGTGMAALFAFFVAGTSVRGLLTERRLGTLDRTLVAPIPPWTPALAKALVGFGLALASMCATWASSVLIFGTTWGDPVAVLALCAAHAAAAATITMLVASRARTESQADGVIMGVSFVVAFFGGSLVPLHNLPEFLQKAALLTPNGWISSGLIELAGSGGGIASVTAPLGVLCAIALVAGGLSAAGLRRGLTR